MPFATFNRVREVSSEDSVHLAENLIKSQPGKKWKTKSVGEKSAYVILDMSESQKITGIDIGNEHSAFIEVLVGKSSSAPEDFTEILITCSFMTPPESKSSTNTNRVRCFNQEALVPTAVEDKWSLLKIVCTQPFNKHVSYGLSFIKVHVSQNVPAKTTNSIKNLVPAQFLKTCTSSESTDVEKLSFISIGNLKFRDDSPDSESENSSSLFNRWKKTKDNESVQTTAASIRLASNNPITNTHRRLSDVVSVKQTSRSTENEGNILDRNRNDLLFGNDNDEDDHNNSEANQSKKERLSKQIEVDRERRRLELQNQADKSKRKSANATRLVECKEKRQIETKYDEKDKTNNPKAEEDNKSKKRKSSPTERPSKKVKTITDTNKYRPFNQLLGGVVLVISGIQNPDRGILRNKALALGAKYKTDWDNTCTHLICAFKNTPKYNQVRGKGKIVTRSWIEKCYSLKKYLPWRRYALDSKELAKPESDDEILDATLEAQNKENSIDEDLPSSSAAKRESDGCVNNLALYDVSDQPINNKIIDIKPESSSEMDTDDEIQRVEQKNQSKEYKPISSKKQDIYEASTDEEDYLQEKLNQCG